MVALREPVLAEVEAVPDSASPRLPVHVTVAEAVRLAAYVDRVWAATDEHPGLRSAALCLGPDIRNDLLGLTVAIQGCPSQSPSDDRTRAEALYDELAAVLRFFCGRADAQLPEVEPEGAPPGVGLRARLLQLAGLANHHRGALHGLGGFKVSQIHDALSVCAHEFPDELAGELPDDHDQVRPLAVVLERKISLVRAAARLTFRHQPALAREAAATIDEGEQVALDRRARAQANDPLPSEEATLY